MKQSNTIWTHIQGVLLCLLWVVAILPGLTQNNAIFVGGIADGLAENCYFQPTANLIFVGGNADGFDERCFQQNDNNLLFAGGVADGFSETCYTQSDQNIIFTGGLADGFSLACFAIAAHNVIFAGGNSDGFDENYFAAAGANDIFSGGMADGFVEGCFFQPNSNLIFAGGIADGFDFSQSLHSPIFPIELLSFDGVYDNGDAWLGWITETEINNSHFDLERSFDGSFFEYVGTVPGAGTTFDMQTYEYRDPVAQFAARNKVIYYRLKQVDFDATFHYSNVVSVTLEATQNSVIAFPNPASQTVFLRFRSQVNHPVSVALFDLHGRQIRDLKFSPDPGLNLFQFDIADLAEGAYYCRVEFGETLNEINTFKIVILR